MPYNFNLPSFSQGFMRAKQDSYDSKIRDMDLRDRQAQQQEALWQREAAAYLAPIDQHRASAISSGMTTADYFAAQMAALQNDEGFKRKSPEVQRYIMRMMTDSATVEANRAAEAKDWDTANAILRSVGQQPRVTERQMVMDRGDPWEIIRFLNQQGQNIGLSEDGQYAVDAAGNKVPVALFAEALRASGSPISGYAAAQRWGDLAQDRQHILNERDASKRYMEMLLADLEGRQQGASTGTSQGYDASQYTVVPQIDAPQPEVQGRPDPWAAIRALFPGASQRLGQLGQDFQSYQADPANSASIGAGSSTPPPPGSVPITPQGSSAMQAILQAQHTVPTVREQELAQISGIEDIAELQRLARIADLTLAPRPGQSRRGLSLVEQRALENRRALQSRFAELQEEPIRLKQQALDSARKEYEKLQVRATDENFLRTLSSEQIGALTGELHRSPRAIENLVRELEELRLRRL